MSQEEQDSFIQKFFGVSSPEEVVQKLFGREMGRRKIKPNFDVLVELLDMTQEDKERFVQKLFGVDSPEEAAQKLLGVSSPEEALRKLSASSHQIS
jgi:hypothetical protein